MKTLFCTILGLLFFLTVNLYSQEEQDTTVITEDSTITEETDPAKAEIIRIIKEVNSRAAEIDNIISDGEIKIKTPKIDESGSIEIHVKKKNDLWFKIEGPLGIDAATGHFARDKFVFFDDLNDVVTTGSTTILNIGTLTKIRCTFDDMINAFSGTVRIPKGKKDILTMTDETGSYVLALKRGTITRKYWVSKSDYSVSKYQYLSSKGQTLISFEFSNFSSHGTGSYAKRVEIRRPKQREYFKITMETVNLNQSYLDFKVDYPYGDVKMRTWK
jgi:outer membrane lipoprotein-sorting protein